MEKDDKVPAATQAAQQFVEGVLATAVLNLQAVEQDLFPQVLCESWDPDILRRWQEAAPRIAAALQAQQAGYPSVEPDKDWPEGQG